MPTTVAQACSLAAGLLAGRASGVPHPRGVSITAVRPDELSFVAGTGVESQNLVRLADKLARVVLDPVAPSPAPTPTARATPLPPYAPRANVLFFVKFGNGPLKYATGQFRDQLRFREGNSSMKSSVVKVAGQTLPAPAYGDLYFQASTRGDRVMDHILAGKAQFKAGAAHAGRIVTNFGVRETTEAVALALMEDIALTGR